MDENAIGAQHCSLGIDHDAARARAARMQPPHGFMHDGDRSGLAVSAGWWGAVALYFPACSFSASAISCWSQARLVGFSASLAIASAVPQAASIHTA
jgi:hypothetical protein